MEIRQFRHFIAVAAHGSFRRAASALHLSQPALSLSIKALETDLGLRLFDRLHDRVAPTAAGAALLRHAEEVIQRVDLVKEAARTLASPQAGTVSIGLGIGLAPATIAGFLLRVSREFPRLIVRVRTGVFDNLINALRDDSYEFLVTRLSGRTAPSDLRQEESFQDQQVIVGSTRHPLARRKSVTAADVARFPWVSSGPLENSLDGWVEFFMSAGSKPPRVLLQLDTFPAINALVNASEFLSVYPRHYAEDPSLRDVLQITHPGIPAWNRSYGCTTRSGRTLSAEATAVMGICSACFLEDLETSRTATVARLRRSTL